MSTHDLVAAPDYSVFSTIAQFETAQRMAKMLAQSDMVPDAYRGRIENCVIALELAHRLRVSAFLIMQNLHVIHGRPSWSSAFVIGAINASGRFEPLQFHLSGEGETRQCHASSRVLATGREVVGPVVSVKMAKEEGWYERKGSKWPNMTDIMLTYRAASFFGRLYAPDITLGMHTSEELHDAPPERLKDMGSAEVVDDSGSVEALNAVLAGPAAAVTAREQAMPAGAPDATPPSEPTPNPTHEPEAQAIAFALAKIIEGAERASSEQDFMSLQAMAETLPEAERAEALGTLGHARAQWKNAARPSRRSPTDDLFQ